MTGILLRGAGLHRAVVEPHSGGVGRRSTVSRPVDGHPTPIRRAMQAYRNLALLSGRVGDPVVREHVRGMQLIRRASQIALLWPPV
jgi:hypothetical protein